jgi:quercetin dioxygenase-like cupin family protein
MFNTRSRRHETVPVTSKVMEKLVKTLILSTVAALGAALALPVFPALAYEPIVSLPGEHTTIFPGGGKHEVLATGEQTDGKFSVMILTNAAGEGPGPSITHTLGSETWLVLDGTYELHVGDTVLEGGPGTFISVDVGQAHGFIAKTDGRLLVTFTPAGYERFFQEWADTPGLMPGPELGALENKYGVTRPAP